MADLPSISVPGIGSGLDVNSIVEGLIGVRKVPFTERNDAKIDTFNNKISGLGSLRSALSDWQTSLFELKLDNTFNQRSVEYGSDRAEQKFTVTGDATAAEGSYDIEVLQTAQSHKLVSNFNMAATDAIGAGTMEFTVGADTFSVEVTATDTLNDVKGKINEASNGLVNATVVTSDTGTSLVMSARDTGEANAISITVTDDDGDSLDGSGLSRLQFDTDYNAGLNEVQAAQDAKIKIDNFLEVSSDTNKFENAIEGVTISVIEPHNPGENDSVTLSLDKESTKESIEAFVDAYNKVIETVDNLTFINRDAAGNRVAGDVDDSDVPLTEEEKEARQKEIERGSLSSESVVRTMMNQIRATLSEPVITSDGSTVSLSILGIETTKEGTLKVDSGKLDKALNNDFDTISEVFSGFDTLDVDGNVISSTEGVADRLNVLVREYEKFGGILQSKSSSYSDSISGLQKDQEDFDASLARYEAQLYSQFLALDTISSELNSIGSFLDQQLSNLPGVVNPNIGKK